MSQSKLFGRSFSLTVGPPQSPTDPNITSQAVKDVINAAFNESSGTDISGFDVAFNVEKNLKPEPNTCSIQVYNLAESTRKAMSGSQSLSVKLEAGYQSATTLLYLGTVRSAWSTREGADIVTHLESGDSEQQFRTARLNINNAGKGAKVPIGQFLKAIIDSLGVLPGNLSQAIPLLFDKGLNTINGGALAGCASRRLTDLMRSIGFSWSIQNGAIQILDINSVLNGAEAIVISAATGMLGSPTVDNKGVVSAETLIIPGLLPGVLVNFDSEFLSGAYKVQQTNISGETWGTNWSTRFTCTKYKP